MRLYINTAIDWFKGKNFHLWLLFFFCIYFIVIFKVVTWDSLDDNLLFGGYSLAIVTYLLSRFALAYMYTPEEYKTDPDYEPTLSFGVPVKNEEDNIRETIWKIAASNYPKKKIEIIAVNDGSTDRTLEELYKGKEEAEKVGVPVTIVNWEKNKGKREGMAECIKRATGELMVFIDSDSLVDAEAGREFAKYFTDKNVAAVTGNTFVANASSNVLTRMQSVRYYISFKVYKSAESVFGAVTCCSGCCSAYRRTYLLEVVDEWLAQSFLGVTCTYGDDRSLTNYLLLKGHSTLFAPEAKSYTFVPDTFLKYMRQQMRWKKSWTRESFKIGYLYMWKQHPLLSISFFLSLILPLFGPIVAIRAMMWFPYVTGQIPWYYIFGLSMIAIVYGVYYYIYTRDRTWPIGIVFMSVYALLLIWQLPIAILTLRDSKWGTR